MLPVETRDFVVMTSSSAANAEPSAIAMLRTKAIKSIPIFCILLIYFTSIRSLKRAFFLN